MQGSVRNNARVRRAQCPVHARISAPSLTSSIPGTGTFHIGIIRETREGWPLLTDKNGDSKSMNERAPYLVGSLGSSCLPWLL